LWAGMSNSESRQLNPLLLWPHRVPSRVGSPQTDSETVSENQPTRSWSTPAMIFSTLLSPNMQQPSNLDPIPGASRVNAAKRSLNYGGDSGQSEDREFQKIVMAIVVALGPKAAAYGAEKLYEVLPMPAQVEYVFLNALII
jgi:hypothetical protein